MKLNLIIAKTLLKLGKHPRFSHNIAGEISAGFGELDEFGFFRFPLTEKDIQKRWNKL